MDERWNSPGTRLVEDIFPGPESSGRFATELEGQLFFMANNGVHGFEPWKSDGTHRGTVRIRDINPGPMNSDIYRLVTVKGITYFVTDDGTHGRELWMVDRNLTRARLIKDLLPGPFGGDPQGLTPVGDKLFFVAGDGVHGYEPWVTDGTASGTRMLVDTDSERIMAEPPSWTAGGKAFFVFNTVTYGNEIWVSDGTPAGTHILKDIRPEGGSIFGEEDFTLPVFEDGFLFNGKRAVVEQRHRGGHADGGHQPRAWVEQPG